MPKITDCLKAEREAADNVIRLARNNNFLRAYNRSAWLFQRVVTEYRVKRQFTDTPTPGCRSLFINITAHYKQLPTPQPKSPKQ